MNPTQPTQRTALRSEAQPPAPNDNFNALRVRGRRRGGRRQGGSKLVLLLHPGHNVRVAYVVPEADITSAGHPPMSSTAGTGDQNVTRLAPPTLCPSCLPLSDPFAQSDCPTSTHDGCRMAHARLTARAMRYDAVHQRRRSEEADGEKGPRCDSGGGEGETVLVGMPNRPAETEAVAAATCLPTRAPLNRNDTARSDAVVSEPAQRRPVDDQDSADHNDPRDMPQHCVHWLKHSLCVFGKDCGFVHCLEPGDRARDWCRANEKQHDADTTKSTTATKRRQQQQTGELSGAEEATPAAVTFHPATARHEPSFEVRVRVGHQEDPHTGREPARTAPPMTPDTTTTTPTPTTATPWLPPPPTHYQPPPHRLPFPQHTVPPYSMPLPVVSHPPFFVHTQQVVQQSTVPLHYSCHPQPQVRPGPFPTYVAMPPPLPPSLSKTEQ